MEFCVQNSSKQREYTWIIYVTESIIYVTSFYQFYNMSIMLPVFILLMWIHTLV